jgi:ferredoxin-NADP reductase
MAGTTVFGGIAWHVATVVERRDESKTARTLVLDVPGWPGHDAGQHVDVRLTADDGYTAVRSYSLANPRQGNRLEVTVEELSDGEVSPYLVHTIAPGDRLEVLGPIGGWFVWRPGSLEPVQLIAGGSGIVPLMAMIRARAQAESRAPFRLIYSVRSPEAVIYAHELEERAMHDDGLNVTFAYTRETPPNWPEPARRLDAGAIVRKAFPQSENPQSYICGPTAFVEFAAALLGEAGYAASRIKTERFGPTGK